MFSPTSYITDPSPSPIHAWNGSSCVLAVNNGASGGAFLTAKHTGGSASVDINGSGEGTAYNVTARHEHPDLDIAILISDANLSALPSVTLADTIPSTTGTVAMRLGGWGRMATGLGGSYSYPREERWVRGYSIDRNIPEDIKPYNWAVSFVEAGALSNTGVACINDSGGGVFDNSTLTLYGVILGTNSGGSGDLNYGASTSGITIAPLRPWIQSKVSNASAPWIKRVDLSADKTFARITFSEAIDWLDTGGDVTIRDDTNQYVSTGTVVSGGGSTNVTTIDIAVGTAESQTGTARTFDMLSGAFQSTVGAVANVAVDNGYVFDLLENLMSAPTPLSMTVKLGYASGAFNNNASTVTIEWDQNVSDNSSGFAYVGDIFNRELGVSASNAAGTPTHDEVAGVAGSVGSRTIGDNLIDADYVVSDTLDANIQANDIPVTWDAGPDLTFTNGVNTSASSTIAGDQARYRSVTALYSGELRVVTTDAGAGLVTNACLSTKILHVGGGDIEASSTNGTAASFTTAQAGQRYVIGWLNTSSTSRSGNTFTISQPVGTPTVSGSTSSGSGVQTTTGLVLQRAGYDDTSVDYFRITDITGGTLYQNDGTTVINANDYITYAQGQAGLKFTPNSNSNGSFRVYGSRSNTGAQLSGEYATATITVVGGNARWRSSPRAGRCR